MTPQFHRQLEYLGKYLRPYRPVLVLSATLSLFSTLLGMIQPYFAKIVIDRVFIGGKAEWLVPLLLMLIVLLLVSFGIRVFNSYIYTRYSARLLFKMREDLFAHLHKIPLKFFSKWKSGDMYSRIASDMAEIQGLVTETFPGFLFDALTAVITGIILLWLNWKMAVISYCVLPFAVIMIHRLRPRLETLARNVAESNADVSHFLLESLNGTALVRTFDAEAAESEKLKEKQSNILKYLLQYQVIGAVSGVMPTAFIIVNSIVVFGYGGYMVLDNTLTLGSLMAFSIYQGRVMAPLQGLMSGFLVLQKSRVSLSRVEEILDIDPADVEDGNTVIRREEFRGEMVFKDVSFAYSAEERLMENISFQVPAGKITALVGPSGVGKTTICHLMMRLFDPDSGTILLDNKPLQHFSRDWLRRQVSLISQDTFLFHTSILENIRFADPKATETEVIQAAETACIDEFVRSLPEGYHTQVGDRGVRLSGGQRQRISIARSILIKPQILILDEATAYLDTDLEDRLKEALLFLMKDKTLLIVSHRDSTIEGVDKIIAIDRTGLTYDGVASGYTTKNKNDGRERYKETADKRRQPHPVFHRD